MVTGASAHGRYLGRVCVLSFRTHQPEIDALAEKRALTLDAARRVAALPGIVIDAPPDLSLFAFHLTWPGATLADEDAATRALMTKTTSRGRVMVTGAAAHGRYLGRVCVLSFRTHQPEINALVEDMAAAIDEIRS